MSQEKANLEFTFEREGNAWHQRNLVGKPFSEVGAGIQHITNFFVSGSVKITRAIEFGSSDGRNLAKLRRDLGCHVTGVEPGGKPFQDSENKLRGEFGEQGWRVINGLPLELSVQNDSFDFVYFGFMLYLTPRAILRDVFEEATRILDKSDACSSFVGFTDFLPGEEQDVRYSHNPELTVYKRDYAKLFAESSLPMRFTEVFRTVYSDDGGHFPQDPRRRISTSLLFLEK